YIATAPDACQNLRNGKKMSARPPRAPEFRAGANGPSGFRASAGATGSSLTMAKPGAFSLLFREERLPGGFSLGIGRPIRHNHIKAEPFPFSSGFQPAPSGNSLMSTLGKILIILNILAGAGFGALVLLDYNKRQAFSYAVFRNDLAIQG